MTRRKPMKRSRARLRPVSVKRQKGKAAWAKVYREVDKRAQGRCEVVWTGPLEPFMGFRCMRPGSEHHHCEKPRASAKNHVAAKIILLCQPHHRQVDAPYATGRLTIVPIGGGKFHCAVTTAPDKFTARAMEAR